MTIVPPPLSPGDRIGIIAPAGRAEPEVWDAGCAIIEELGFTPTSCAGLGDGTGYLAADDPTRLDNLHQAWQNPELKALLAVRGGYGSLRIVSSIDLTALQAQPKWLIGFSDCTILLNQLFLKTGMICLHAPVLSSLVHSDQQTRIRLKHCLTGNWHQPLKASLECYRSASNRCRGTILGGNLSSLVSMLGTPCAPDFNGALLFLEDVNEPEYRLDRLLTQLQLAGKLQCLAGILLGSFDTGDNLQDRNDPLRDFVAHRLLELTADQTYPIWGGLAVGHGVRNLPLPIGAEATVETTSGRLFFERG